MKHKLIRSGMGSIVTRRRGRGSVGKKKVVAGSVSAIAMERLRQPEPRELAELSERMRQDYQIRLAERILTANVKSAPVSISVVHKNGADNDPRISKLQELCIVLWKKTLKSMMMCVGDGRVAFEKIWIYDKESNLTFIRKLEDLPFRNTEMLLWKSTDNVDDSLIGAFRGIKLTGGPEEIELSPRKSWWLALDPTSTHPHGDSRFTGAPYNTWKDRQELKRLRGLFIRRFAMGGGIAHVPEETILEDGTVVDVFEATAQSYDELLSGGIMMLPNDREMTANGPGDYLYDFTNAELTIRDGSPLSNMVHAMDSEQLLSFGIPPKTVIEGDAVGSFAMVSQQMLILFSVIEDILDQLTDSFQLFVVDKQVEVNWEPDEAPKLTMTYKKLTERPDDLAVELVRGWLTTSELSPFVLSGAIDVSAILDMVGIAVTEDAKKRLKAMIEAARKTQEQPEPQSQEPSGGLPVASGRKPSQNGNGQTDSGEDQTEQFFGGGRSLSQRRGKLRDLSPNPFPDRLT